MTGAMPPCHAGKITLCAAGYMTVKETDSKETPAIKVVDSTTVHARKAMPR